MKKIILMIVVALLTACSSAAPVPPTAVPTELPPTATELPPTATPTLEPSATPTVTASPTPEPTATSTSTATPTNTPAPQVINSSNAAGLVRSEIVTMPYLPVLEKSNEWEGYARWSPDGSQIYLRTDQGLIVVDPETLEHTALYKDWKPFNLLADGRIAVFNPETFGILNPEDGEVQPFDVDVAKQPNGDYLPHNISRDGSTFAFEIAPMEFAIYTLATGEMTTISIQRRIRLAYIHGMRLSNDGRYLMIWGMDAAYTNTLLVWDLESQSFVFEEIQTESLPVISPNGENIIFQTGTRNATYPIQRIRDGLVIGRVPSQRSVFPPAFAGDDTHVGVFYLDERANDGVNYEFLIWDTDTLKNQRIASIPDWGLDIDFSSDGARFIILNRDGTLVVGDTASDAITATSNPYLVMSPPSLSPNGERAALTYSRYADLIDIMSLEATSRLEYTGIEFQGFAVDRSLESAQAYFLTDTLVNITFGSLLNMFGSVYGVGSTFWNADDGTFLRKTTANYYECHAGQAGALVNCAYGLGNLFFNGLRTGKVQNLQTLALENGAQIDISTQLQQYIRLDPVNPRYVTCTEGAASFSIVGLSEEGNVERLLWPCQPFIFHPNGELLILQDGTVLNIGNDEVIALLQTNDGAPAFPTRSGSIERQTEFGGRYPSSQLKDGAAANPYFTIFPEYAFSPDGNLFIVGETIFDLSTGAKLAELDLPSTIYGAAFSEDGLSLKVLTPHGLEIWQVLE